MKVAIAGALVVALGLASASAQTDARLASADPATCRANESGPALLAEITGFKDREGNIRIELYPPVDGEFLGNSKLLLEAGKDFRRIDLPVPPSGPVTLCIRAPHAGAYAVSVLHDRKRDGKFAAMSDGAGFGNNPHLGFSQPKAAAATMAIGPGVTETRIVLNYFHGLTFGPLKGR